MSSILYFRVEVPGVGARLRIRENPNEVAVRLRIAAKNETPTITVTNISDKEVVIPTDLIGPIERNR